MPLDFSKLDKLAYRGFEKAEQAEERDALIEQGFTYLEGIKTPFDAPQEPSAEKPMPAPEQPAKRQLKPFVGFDGTDYRKCFRLAFNFLEKYMPPRLSEDYWENPSAEFIELSAKLGESSANNDFIASLMVAVYTELERQHDLLESRQGTGQP